MELLLVRHALPHRVVRESGPADPELAERGLDQAKLVGLWLAQEKIDAVYASPLRRAVQTATAIAAPHGLDPLIEDDVAEWDRDDPEYIPVEELKATNHPSWQAMAKGEWAGSGDPQEFHDRVVGGIERIIAAHPGGSVVVACHGGVINCYFAHILGVPNTSGFFHPEYTSINRVMASSKGVRTVHSLNEIPHLRGTGLL